jgi:type IV pilus assembly protein PilV
MGLVNRNNKTRFQHAPRTCASVRQSGVTLVEVLVSVLLMSFALLGMAALQAQSMAQQTSSTTRGNLSSLISDVADRLRSNLSSAPGYSPGNTAFTLSTTWAAQATIPAAPTTDCKATACDVATRSTYDLVTWQRKVRSELPQGSALISGDVQSGVNVTVMWFDKDFRSGDVLNQSPTCTNTMTAGQAQTCCPAAASAPAGVRCHRTTLIP